jgi:hypothetical protein
MEFVSDFIAPFWRSFRDPFSCHGRKGWRVRETSMKN